MDTRGKTVQQIRAAIVELADKLPDGHPLIDVPESFPDRGQAIAAFTNMRQTLFQLDQKASNTMASKKAVAAETPVAEMKKAKAVKAAAKPGKEPKAAKAAGETKAKANGDVAPKEKKARKSSVDLTGPFKLSKAAVEAKAPEGLRLHEGSARFALMSYAFKNAKKAKLTAEELVTAGGDTGRAALGVMVKLGHLIPAA